MVLFEVLFLVCLYSLSLFCMPKLCSLWLDQIQMDFLQGSGFLV